MGNLFKKCVNSNQVIYCGPNITTPLTINKGDTLTEIIEAINAAIGGGTDLSNYYTMAQVDTIANYIMSLSLGATINFDSVDGSAVNVSHTMGTTNLIAQVVTNAGDVVNDAVMTNITNTEITITVPAGNYYLKVKKLF